MSRYRFHLPAVLALLASGIAVAPAWACSGGLHLETGPAGVYRLDFADAVKAQPGLAGCAVEHLQMTNRGKPVPIRIISDNGTFDAGDRIEWVGKILHGQESWFDPYSRANVYELRAADGQHPRYLPRAAGSGPHAPAGLARHLHLETDTMMIRLKTDQVKAGEQPDVWYWSKLTMVDPKPFSTGFDLPGLHTDVADSSITLAFRGWSKIRAPEGESKPHDHHVRVALNGTHIADLEWDGEAHIERTLKVPAGLLRAAGNTIRLEVPEREPSWTVNPLVDVVMFDFIDLSYPLASPAPGPHHDFQITRAGAPALATTSAPLLFGSDGNLYQPSAAAGTVRYAAIPAGVELTPLAAGQSPLTPAGLRPIADQHDWRQSDAGHDYIIIAHPSLLEAIEPLAAFHRERGLDPVVIDVNAAYDQFNHGIVNPVAIRDLLKYAWDHWPAPKPHYVLLVGDASFDPHDKLRDQKFYSKWTDRELLLPGQFGRIPGTPYADAPDSANARNLIPSFQYFAHEGQSASDNDFVAFEPDSHKPMLAIGRFPVVTPADVTAIVNKTINYVRNPQMGSWRQSIMFITNDDKGFQNTSNELAATMGGLGFSPAKIYPKTSDKDNVAHQKTIMEDINEGQLLVHFLGHGGRYIWRTGPPDPVKNHDLFTLDMVSDLNNAGRLPMILAMTCYSAPFDNPTEDSIGEKFLREADKGAIAVFAASWRNAPDSAFSTMLMKDLVHPGIMIGDAILQAKQATSNQDMIRMYNLLGDPAIALQRPQEKLQMAQIRDRWNPGVVVRVPGASAFAGRMRVTWLDQDHDKLAEQVYNVHSPQLRLPAAPEGARHVRVYALDPARDADALGELTLVEPKPERPWWVPAPKPVPLAPAADRIHGSNMGG